MRVMVIVKANKDTEMYRELLQRVSFLTIPMGFSGTTVRRRARSISCRVRSSRSYGSASAINSPGVSFHPVATTMYCLPFSM